MSEPKFTPGKWYVENGVPGKPRIFSSAKNLLTPIVCECIGARSRRKHDAALISAAPEMYALLQKIVEIVGEAAEAGYTTVTGDRILEQGKAILQKARGEK